MAKELHLLVVSKTTVVSSWIFVPKSSSYTWFQHKSSKQVTYKEPGTTHLPTGSASLGPYPIRPTWFLCLSGEMAKFGWDVFSDPFANIDSDHFPVLTKVRANRAGILSRSLRRQSQTWTNMWIHSSTQLILAMNRRRDGMCWGKYIYTPSLTIYRYRQSNQAALNLMSARGDARLTGDLAAVHLFNKIIKSARKDKKQWLDEQLEENN